MPPIKTSKWITHVKAYSKANTCSYGDAMSGAKSSYQKGSGLRSAHDWIKNENILSRSATFLLDNNLVGKHGNRIGQIRDITDKYGYGK
jgi:hypothetical protein